jgi:lysyl endopeptidase
MVATKQASGTFSGDVFETNGPAFTVTGFDSQLVRTTKVGAGWIALDDGDHVRVNMSEGIARALTRQSFGAVPKCAFGLAADASADVNFTDLWWNSAESGWGVNLAHQGDTIFAAWYTYGTSGAPLFLVATLHETELATFEGDLYRATGPAGSIKATQVGTAKLFFTNGNSAILTTTTQLDGMTAPMTRASGITRQIFAAPGAACQ